MITSAVTAAFLACMGAAAAKAEPPVKVFLLAGQSNMEGQGAVNTRIDFLDRRGPLTLLANSRRITRC